LTYNYHESKIFGFILSVIQMQQKTEQKTDIDSDVALEIATVATANEEVLVGKNTEKGLILSEYIEEIAHTTPFPLGIAEIIAKYRQDAIEENWILLSRWFKYCDKNHMLMKKISFCLLLNELLKIIFGFLLLSPAMHNSNLIVLIMISVLSEFNFSFFLLSLSCHYYTKPKELQKLSAEMVDDINEEDLISLHDEANRYLDNEKPYKNCYFILLFGSSILSGATTFIFCFLVNDSVDKGIKISAGITSAMGVGLASHSIYRMHKNKQCMLKDRAILSQESPDYAALTLG
jgi:hypothetical protein